MSKPKLIIFASGTSIKGGGGSGFEKLVENSRTNNLDAEIVAVVSNHENGGVRNRADKLEIPFIHFLGPFSADEYERIVKPYHPCFIALSGWLKPVKGLSSDSDSIISAQRTLNIHPGPLPDFGGPGMYGHHVHEAVIAAFKRGEIKESAVSMHFVTEKYDDGPVFFHYPVKINISDTPESLAERVNRAEHFWQSYITRLVVSRGIRWDGRNPRSLIVPGMYEYHIKP
ncbi:MAG: formyltransferase family protein [bacterium]